MKNHFIKLMRFTFFLPLTILLYFISFVLIRLFLKYFSFFPFLNEDGFLIQYLLPIPVSLFSGAFSLIFSSVILKIHNAYAIYICGILMIALLILGSLYLPVVGKTATEQSIIYLFSIIGIATGCYYAPKFNPNE
jgi:hypothetical protein